jgi:hypothetical protein
MKTISVKTLGSNGRFGNQIFQLAAALGLARKYNAEVLVPSDWIGRNIFQGFVAQLGSSDKTDFYRAPLDELFGEYDLSELQSIDLFGYFQYNTGLYSSTDLYEWFNIKDYWKQKFPFRAEQAVVCHVRRGDYVAQPTRYCSILDESYHRLLERIEATEEETYWCTEENPQVDDECESLGIGFLPDFMTCLRADVLVRSNSTFSMVAGWLGPLQVYSPVVGDLVGWQDVEFVKGNHPKCASSMHHPVRLEDMDI